MTDDDYKKFTVQAKAAIKGEAFFETLVSDYCIPHHIVGPKDVGVDYICEWVYGDKPTGVLYAAQVKTLRASNATVKSVDSERGFNKLAAYSISAPHLRIDERTQQYWRGLGMPFFLFVVLYPEPHVVHGQLECYYKRFTPVLTADTTQEQEDFYKVNDGATFLAFADQHPNKHGFARDLFIDLIRCSYHRGSIAYLSPRTIGLEQFPDEDAVFGDLFKVYQQAILKTYEKTKHYIERIQNDEAESSAGPSE